MIKYACSNHVDDAMDDVINEKETFPVLSETKGEKCSYCNEECTYQVKL